MMKRSSFAADETPVKSHRFNNELLGDLGWQLSRRENSPPVSDDTQIRGCLSHYNMPDAPSPGPCIQGSPGDESLCSGPATVSIPGSSHEGRSMNRLDEGLPASDLEPISATASTDENRAPKGDRCKRRVHFAPGPLEKSADGHPEFSSQVVRSVRPCTPTAYHPTEALTRHNLTAMENELGEEFKTENAASLVRLRRRLGMIPMCPIPRPYVTVRNNEPTMVKRTAIASKGRQGTR